MPLVPDFFVDDVDLVDDVDNHLSKDVGEAVRTVNGTAVLEYGNHLPFSACLNENGSLIADTGYPEPVAKPHGFASSH